VGADLLGDLLGVEVADFCECVWEAGDDAEVDVVGAVFSAGEFEDAEFEGVDFYEDFCHFGFLGLEFGFFGHVVYLRFVTW